MININDVNDPPLLSDTSVFVNETDVAGTLIYTGAWGPLLAVDPEGTPPKYAIIAGNDRLLFGIGPGAGPRANYSAGQLWLADGVNVGNYAGTRQCTCAPKYLDYEEAQYIVLIVRATDGLDDSLFTQASVTVTLLNTNDAPTFSQASYVATLSETDAYVASAAAPLSFGDPVLADDEDASVGDLRTYFLSGVKGAMGVDSLANLPVIPQAAWPFSVPDNTTGAIQLNAPVDASSATVMVNGYAAKGIFQLSLCAQDQVLATSCTSIVLYILANVSSALPLDPYITDFSVSGGTMATDGGSAILITGTNLDVPSLVLLVSYAQTGSNVFFNSSCVYSLELSSPPDALVMNCSTQPGTGQGFTWTFLRRIGNAVSMVPFSSTLRLVSSYTSPTINGIGPRDETQSATSLSTAGGQILIIDGDDFGPSTQVHSSISVSATSETPLGVVRYVFMVVSISHTTLTVSTPPGVGAQLRVKVVVGGQVSTGGDAQHLAYATADISSIQPVPNSQVAVSKLAGAGGDAVLLIGSNFGPMTLSINGATVAYAPHSTYGVPLDTFTTYAFVNCSRAAESCHTRMVCLTAPGIGYNLSVTMVSPVSLQTSLPSAPLLSYARPTITSVNGGRGMSTAGDERLTLIGTNMGTGDIQAAGRIELAASYGLAAPYTTIAATACYVSQLVRTVTPTIVCSTGEGTGTGFGLVVGVRLRGNELFQTSDVHRSKANLEPFGYAAPILSSFSGAYSAANTVGGEMVSVHGLNLGADMSLVDVHYTLELKAPEGVLPIENGTQVTQVTYLPAACTLATPHYALQCVLTAGTGGNLLWRVVVDGQVSRAPTTSYAPPVITGLSLLTAYTHIPSTGANTNGGDIVLVSGSGFGPFAPTGFGGVPLLQGIFLRSNLGVEVKLAPRQWRHMGDSLINITLPGGTGFDWAVYARVADREADSGDMTFDYASPAVTAIAPRRGPCSGGTRVVVTGVNLGLADPLNEVAVVFGNPSDGSLVPQAILASRMLRSEGDGSSGASLYYLDRVVFRVPPGFGAGRVIRLASYRSGYSIPNVYTLPIGPRGLNCNASSGYVTGGITLADACDGIDQYSYDDPAVTAVVITRPISISETTFAAAHFAEPETVRVLTLYGANFGVGVIGSPPISRTLENWNTVSSTWEINDGTYLFDLAAWKNDHVVAYTALTAGTLRVRLTSADWSGNSITQYSNSSPFFDYSPVSSLTTAVSGIPTTGGLHLNFTVQYLLAAAQGGFKVDINGVACPLVDPMTPNRLITSPVDSISRIVTNDAVRYPNNPPTTATLWSVNCVAPPGMGSSVPLVITRYPPVNGVTSRLEETVLSYFPPALTRVWVGQGVPPSVIPVYDATYRYVAETHGTGLLVLEGANLGTCPIVHLATHVLCYCVDGCPVEGVSLTDSQSPAFDVMNSASSDHTRLVLRIPPGEGDGLALTGDGIGWTIAVQAGDQYQTSGVVLFAYALPSITSVTSAPVTTGSSTGVGFPTRGGVLLEVAGANFGSRLPNLVIPTANLDLLTPQLYFQTSPGRVMDSNPMAGTPVGYTPCINTVRMSHSRMQCVLPPGVGAGLSAQIQVFGRLVSAAVTLDYSAPQVTSLALLPPASNSLNSNASAAVWDDSGAIAIALASAANPALASLSSSDYTLQVPAAGKVRVAINGSNLGDPALGVVCLFLPWRHRLERPLICDSRLNYHGEGEVHTSSILMWTHERIVFEVPAGGGYPLLVLQVAGQVQVNGAGGSRDPSFGTGAPLIQYAPPVVTGRLSPDHGPTDTAVTVTLVGRNFGTGPTQDTPVGFPITYPQALTPTSAAPPTYSVRVNWGPQPLGNTAQHAQWQVPQRTGPCLCSALAADGTRAVGCEDCRNSVIHHSDWEMVLASHPGVGSNVTLSVSIIDGPDVYTSVTVVAFDYDPPTITRFAPQPIIVGLTAAALLRVNGINFGTAAVMEAFLPDYTPNDASSIYNQAALTISGHDAWCTHSMRTRIYSEEVVECNLQSDLIVVGAHNTTVVIAGQEGTMSSLDPAALRVVCARTYWGRIGETCLPCQSQGATCAGYVESSPRILVDGATPSWVAIEQVYDLTVHENVRYVTGYHTYPRPTAGFYTLNGTTESGVCPAAVRNLYAGRDTCIVKCEPDEACLGDNYCANGYVSTAPLYRCASCALHFYRQNGLCVACPDNPWAVFLGFGLMVIAAATGGYLLNRKGVNIAILSIGIDFFQVIAIIGNSRVQWPAAITVSVLPV